MALVIPLFFMTSICNADGFDPVRCGSDVRKALVGRKMPNEKDVVRDVLKFPKHSKESPAFIGSCQLNGHDLPGTAIGVLSNENGVQILPAVSTWKIDEKQMKFVQLQTERLRCARDGIITGDGGL